jgi:hypothetical protein
MGKFQTLSIEDLEGVAIRVSRKFSSKSNWKHEDFNTLPSLEYDYLDTDKRFKDKSDELRLYRNAYWKSEIEPSVTHQEQYERDLREAVLEAIQNVKDKWNVILAKELERDFK